MQVLIRSILESTQKSMEKLQDFNFFIFSLLLNFKKIFKIFFIFFIKYIDVFIKHIKNKICEKLKFLTKLYKYRSQ